MASDYAQSRESRIDGIRALNSARGSSLEISSFVYAAIEMHIVFRNRNDLNFVGYREFLHQPLQREIASGQSRREIWRRFSWINRGERLGAFANHRHNAGARHGQTAVQPHLLNRH